MLTSNKNGPPRNVSGIHDQHWNELLVNFSNPSAQIPDDEAEQAERDEAVSTRNENIQTGCARCKRHRTALAVARMISPTSTDLRRRRADVAQHHLDPCETGADSSS